MDKDLKSKTFGALERLVVELGGRRYLAGYIFSFIHTRGVTDISAITPLSKAFRARLTEQGYYISELKIAGKLTDPDGTMKYVFGLSDGGQIESVLLFDDDRRTLCVSTQLGCAMGCVFCATGQLGFTRNLTPAEIVDQVNLIEASSATDKRITNVVFMGMGEPLANYDAVVDSVRILNHPAGKHIGIRHLTISTCGDFEKIEKLAGEDIQPRLAISLNAPTDAIRQKIMPVAKKFPLDQLLQAVEIYQRRTKKRVTFEYCMIKGVNDTASHARLLAKRLRPFMCNVNLIEYNPYPGCELRPSGRVAIERFARVLKESGMETTVRLKMGQSINAACGQLGAAWLNTSGPNQWE